MRNFTYDSRGRRTSATDQNGKTTSYAYDTADRLTTVTDAASNVTTYNYDTENNLLGIADANSHTTNFTYDAFGRVTQTTFPSSFYESYAYDAIGNLTSKTDRKGQTIQYVYDALNRLTQKSYPDSTSAAYTYDLASRIQQVNDPTGTYAFAYDNMGRLIGTTTNYSFLSGTTFTNAYTYDAASNRTGYTSPDGSTNTYSYDTLNRLTTLANSWAGSFNFTYDTLSRRTQMTRPNGVNTNYTYDSLSRLLSVLHQNGASTIDGASYTLDSAGNRTSKTDQMASVTSNYAYDAIYELTQVTQAANTTESYTYDSVGNRLSSLTAATSSYNASNQLTANSNATYTYDSNGNTTSKTDSTGTTSYTWDFENRLTNVAPPGTSGTVSFKYDPFGRRVYKSSSSATSIFTHDGNDLAETTDGGGNLLARYTQGPGIDEPLAQQQSGTMSYYNADGLGSITSMTNPAGSSTAGFIYDSFGNIINSSGTTPNFFSYTAREFDPETQLHFYRARYYDRSAGRFISEDPVGFRSGVNFYGYVKNMPTVFTDPTGLFPTSWHRQITYDLAHAVFGPKCLDKAKAVADANANVDSFNYGIGWGPIGGTWGFLQFIVHAGKGWDQPGAHFPSAAMLDLDVRYTMTSCSLGALGETLHSLQDSWAHSGWSSFDHYTHGSTPDTNAVNNAAIADPAMLGTVQLAQGF